MQPGLKKNKNDVQTIKTKGFAAKKKEGCLPEVNSLPAMNEQLFKLTA